MPGGAFHASGRARWVPGASEPPTPARRPLTAIDRIGLAGSAPTLTDRGDVARSPDRGRGSSGAEISDDSSGEQLRHHSPRREPLHVYGRPVAALVRVRHDTPGRGCDLETSQAAGQH